MGCGGEVEEIVLELNDCEGEGNVFNLV